MVVAPDGPTESRSCQIGADGCGFLTAEGRCIYLLSTSFRRHWERGKRKPHGPALVLHIHRLNVLFG